MKEQEKPKEKGGFPMRLSGSRKDAIKVKLALIKKREGRKTQGKIR